MIISFLLDAFFSKTSSEKGSVNKHVLEATLNLFTPIEIKNFIASG